MTHEEIRSMIRGVLDVQNACNLSAVVYSFARDVSKLWDWARSNLDSPSTEWINTHPISILYADKIASLTGVQSLGNGNFGLAYTWAAHEVLREQPSLGNKDGKW